MAGVSPNFLWTRLGKLSPGEEVGPGEAPGPFAEAFLEKSLEDGQEVDARSSRPEALGGSSP